jgi:hypothetical protein
MEFDMMINTRFYLHGDSKFNSNRELWWICPSKLSLEISI